MSSSQQSGVCRPLILLPSPAKLAASYTLRDIFIIVSTVCVSITCAGVIILVASHLLWRADYHRQKQYMRIVQLLSMFGVFNYVTLWYYDNGFYFQSATKVYETLCLAFFYNLMIHTRLPDPAERINFFVGLERQHRFKKQARMHDKGSLRWFRVRSMLVFQSPVVSLLIFIINLIIESTGCRTGRAVQIATLTFQLVNIVATVLALVSILHVYHRLRKYYQGTKVLSKFFAFKGFIWVILHQQFIFAILQGANAVPPTEYMSKADFAYGVPAFMVCCETLIFLPIYAYAFNAMPFRAQLKRPDIEVTSKSGSVEQDSIWRYLLALVVPTDVIQESWQGAKTFAGLFRGAHAFDYTGGTGVTFLQRQTMAASSSHEALHGDSSASEGVTTSGSETESRRADGGPALEPYDVLGSRS